MPRSKRVDQLWDRFQSAYVSSQPSTQYPFLMPQQKRVNQGESANQPWAKSPNQSLVDMSNQKLPKFRK